MVTTNALTKSQLNYVRVSGKALATRYGDFKRWVDARRELGVWPYSRVMVEPATHHTVIADEFGDAATAGINFSSQDYLGLADQAEIRALAHAAIDRYGYHSAGSPALCGRTPPMMELEHKLAVQIGTEDCIVYPTGWAAGFGVLVGLVRDADTVMIDTLCHNCLQEGARHATTKISKFGHNDLDQLETLLREERAGNVDGAIFIVTESLFSMDSDSPDLLAIMALAANYEAIIILDVAHDFGAMGKKGLGLLETLVDILACPYLVVMGSFSKTFASNGGFVASSSGVVTYLRSHSFTQVFSNALSPMQAAVALGVFDTVFSPTGAELRSRLAQNIQALRLAMIAQGLRVAGTPSPIVPVFTGAKTADEALARLTSKHLRRNGLHANMAEFPAVPRGLARFRFQVMASHQPDEIQRAAEIMGTSRAQAAEDLHHLAKDSPDELTV